MQAVELWSWPGTTKCTESVCQILATAHSEPLSGQSSRGEYRISADCYVAAGFGILSYLHRPAKRIRYALQRIHIGLLLSLPAAVLPAWVRITSGLRHS